MVSEGLVRLNESIGDWQEAAERVIRIDRTNISGASCGATLTDFPIVWHLEEDVNGQETVDGVIDEARVPDIDRGPIADGSCGATLTSVPMVFSSVDPALSHISNAGDVRGATPTPALWRRGR